MRTMGPKETASEIMKFAQPINFSELEDRGVSSKEGAWYRVHKFNALPEHATCKISGMEQDSKGIKVKFWRASKKTQRLAKQLEKMGFGTIQK